MATATANGFSRTSGFVEQIKRSDNRVAIKLGEHWFSKFGSLEVSEGDELLLSYAVVEKDGRVYRNIKSVEPIQHNPAPTSTPTGNTHSDKDTAIARAVAIKAAVAWVHASASLDDVLDTADAFLAWLQGGHTPPAFPAAGPDIGDGDNIPF